jgi:hypothetical protein
MSILTYGNLGLRKSFRNGTPLYKLETVYGFKNYLCNRKIAGPL